MTLARKNLLWVVCILVACAIVPRLFSSTPSTPQLTEPSPMSSPVEMSSEARAVQDIRAGYDRMEAAIKAEDAGRYAAILAPGYTWRPITDKIVIDRPNMERMFREGFPTLSVAWRARVLHTTVLDHSAIVQQELTATMTPKRPRGALSWEIKWKLEDTWTLTDQEWRLARSKTLSVISAPD